MYKTERPFRVDVHRNSLFLSSGEGRGGGGGDAWCFVTLCCADTVGKVRYLYTSYYIHFSHM